MASNRNDDMDRNRSTPQGNTKNPSSQGHLDRDRSEQGRATGMDPVNRDREMNRDTEVGQRDSGSGQSGRDTFGSDRGTGVGTSDTSKKTGRGDSDITE